MEIIFLIIAAFTLFAAFQVVTKANLVHAALWLIVALFGVAATFALLNAGFLAVVQVVVYIGAIAVLMIFAIGLYALFFRSYAHGEGKGSHNKTLSWKRIKNMGGMDEMLLKVIIMLLAVSFLEFMLSSGISTLDWTVLVVPLTIIALALGLKWMSAASEEEQKEERSVEKTSSQNGTLDALERLANLHERGAVNDAEFEDAKLKLLAGE